MIDDIYDDEAPYGSRSIRWGRGLIGVVIVALAALAAAVHSPLVAVETIDILGANRADVARLVAETGLGPGALLLYVDTEAIERAVRTDPWVLDVRASRVWPDTVIVEVLEHDPLVWIEGVENWMLVGRDGTVLEIADAPGTGLMRASLAFPDRAPGEDPSDPAWQEVVEIALVLADDIGGTLELEMRGVEMWTTAFGHDVRLGHPTDLADKGRTLRAMVGSDLPDGAVIDVSSPLRPAVIPPESPGEVEPSGNET